MTAIERLRKSRRPWKSIPSSSWTSEPDDELDEDQKSEVGESGKAINDPLGDGKPDGKKSIGGSGEMIELGCPTGASKVIGVKIHGSRYGQAQPPKESFLIYFLSKDRKRILHTEMAPYSLFKRGAEAWVEVKFESPVAGLPQVFWLVLDFRAAQTKGRLCQLRYDDARQILARRAARDGVVRGRFRRRLDDPRDLCRVKRQGSKCNSISRRFGVALLRAFRRDRLAIFARGIPQHSVLDVPVEESDNPTGGVVPSRKLEVVAETSIDVGLKRDSFCLQLLLECLDLFGGLERSRAPGGSGSAETSSRIRPADRPHRRR